MGRQCCCGGGSYNLIFLNRTDGSSGKTTDFPYLDEYSKRKRRWVHKEPKSTPADELRERVNDLYVYDENNIFAEVDFDFGASDGFQPEDGRMFNINGINNRGRVNWTSEHEVHDLLQYLTVGSPNTIDYWGQKVSAILPNKNLVYLGSAIGMVALSMNCVDINGNVIWTSDFAGDGHYVYNSIRGGNKILVTAEIPDSTFSPGVITAQGVKVYNTDGGFETDIIDVSGIFISIGPVGLIENNIYTIKSEFVTSFMLQKRTSGGSLSSEISIIRGNRHVYAECYGNYIWLAMSSPNEVFIFDEDLNEIINFGLDELAGSFPVRVLPIENDGIYVNVLNGGIIKKSWDGELIWNKLYTCSDSFTASHSPFNIGLDIYSDTEIVVGGNTFSTNDQDIPTGFP